MTARLACALLACALTLAVGAFSLRMGIYGFTSFLVIPALLGSIVTWAVRPATALRAAGVGALTVLGASVSLLLLGVEGAACIAMTLPLAMPLGAMGGLAAHYLQPARLNTGGAAVLLLLPIASFTWDVNATPPIFEVHTALEIAATPEVVWKNVVTFSDLAEPREWYFRAGLAYPKRARIEGTGEGAVRYCEFSTGPFVEPIKVWNEPRLLRFSVTQNPEPMHEWSPYSLVLPKHLNGYMLSKQGQFLLTRLSDGHTLLEGTTWYQHGLWPAGYWRWWSDAIIHRIHLRVLNHIKTLSE